MDNDRTLAYFFNGNLQMALLATRHMIEISKEEDLKASLLEDLHAFEKIESALLNIKGADEIKGLSDVVCRSTEFAMDLKVGLDDSPRKKRQMLATGYQKAVASLTENINDFPDDDPRIIQLAQGYLTLLKQLLTKYKGL